jgi:hypothetical protein
MAVPNSNPGVKVHATCIILFCSQALHVTSKEVGKKEHSITTNLISHVVWINIIIIITIAILPVSLQTQLSESSVLHFSYL